MTIDSVLLHRSLRFDTSQSKRLYTEVPKAMKHYPYIIGHDECQEHLQGKQATLIVEPDRITLPKVVIPAGVTVFSLMGTSPAIRVVLSVLDERGSNSHRVVSISNRRARRFS